MPLIRFSYAVFLILENLDHLDDLVCAWADMVMFHVEQRMA